MLHRFPASDLRKLRDRAGLNSFDVLRFTGISRNTLYRLEHAIGKPQTTTIRRLLNLYAIHISKREHITTSWQTTKAAQSEARMAGIDPARKV